MPPSQSPWRTKRNGFTDAGVIRPQGRSVNVPSPAGNRSSSSACTLATGSPHSGASPIGRHFGHGTGERPVTENVTSREASPCTGTTAGTALALATAA